MLQTMKNVLMLVEGSDPFLFKEEIGGSRGKEEKEDISQCLCMTSRNIATFPGGFFISRVPIYLLSSGQFRCPPWTINYSAGIS